ncbi:hypothetical protein CC78DRAFT_527893 [Lojkania enalia]|uniref:Uncharacterized protein n=1 Tax=Lojkania enalia TaxID=147567 RepID=A0A9P4TQW9_9PLEO|nr:hypothetical protein CC78DRAFT_527893 [Didymosphaeria enalia]
MPPTLPPISFAGEGCGPPQPSHLKLTPQPAYPSTPSNLIQKSRLTTSHKQQQQQPRVPIPSTRNLSP